MRHLIIFWVLLGIILVTFTASAQLPSMEGVVSAWLFDDGSGTTAANSLPGGPSGTIVGGPTWVTGVGGIGQALQFDGVDDYVTVQANPLSDQRSFTIQMYIKNLNSGNEKKFFNIAFDESFKFLWEVKDKNAGGMWAPCLYLKWENVKEFEQSPIATYDGSQHLYEYNDQWHHVAAVAESMNENEVIFRQYVDHVETFSDTVNFAGLLGTCNIIIGTRFSLDKGWFIGCIDNVVLYDKVLTVSEFLPKPEDITGVVNNPADLPANFTLNQNYPNPFNPNTEISYQLPKSCIVTLKIYDVNGRLMKNLVHGFQSSGLQSIEWDGMDNLGNAVSSGIYFYSLKAGNFMETRRMLLIR